MYAPRVARYVPRPFEFLVLLAAFLGGMVNLIGMVAPETGLHRASSVTHLSLGVQIAWYSLLAVGGSVGSFSQLMVRRKLMGLMLEKGALYLVGSGCLIYTVTIFVAAGTRGLTAAIFLFALAGASFLRIILINEEARNVAILQSVLAHREEDE